MATDTLERFQTDCRAAVQSQMGSNAPTLVFGDGQAHSPALMLVGEAPGEQEALQGKPFVGKAGKNLTVFLAAIGMNRADLYISNVVKFRPSRVSAAGRQVNRPPTRAEIALFTPWLMREVALIRPQALVTLGNVALNAFLDHPAMIGDHHGRWQDARITGDGFAPFSVPLFALYHPASVIYNRSLEEVYRIDLAVLKATRTRSGMLTDG